MNRRQYLATLGTLAAGSAGAIGTGAFTSVNASRSVSVQTAADSNAFLGLKAGDSGLVTGTEEGTLEINLDGKGALGNGVNFNAVTTIGAPDKPSDDYAFKVVNQGTKDLMFKMNYYFNNPSWIEKYSGEGVGINQSYIKFMVFGDGEKFVRTYPDQYHANNDHPIGQPKGSGFGRNSENYLFDSGDEYYVVIEVDTTGDRADPNDDLSGSAILQPAVTTNDERWDPRSPPK